MKQKKNTIRIFISSTFKDMHSERDYLVRQVFPELKDKCMKRGLNLIEVDLRWGITEEEMHQGKVLDVCVREIEKCKPFFIGILGERYGEYIKEETHYNGIFSFFHKDNQDQSYTALEIHHGILKNPELRPRAFFYYRDPAFVAEIPEGKKIDIISESDDAKTKLKNLKEDIRKTFEKYDIPGHISTYPCKYLGLKIYWKQVRDVLNKSSDPDDLNVFRALEKSFSDTEIIDNTKYNSLSDVEKRILDKYFIVYLKDLDEFGKLVKNQLWKAILEEYPDTDIPNDPHELENRLHDQFVSKLNSFFIGREDKMLELVNYINGKDNRPKCITGDPGSGKSAFLATFIKKIKRNQPYIHIIPHFIGATPNSVDVTKTIARLIKEIRLLFDFEGNEDLPLDFDSLKVKLRETLHFVNAKHRKIVIVIDAINQFNKIGKTQNISWIPTKLPENVKIIFSTTNESQQKLLKKFGFTFLSVDNLTNKQSRQILIKSLALYRKSLKKKQVDEILKRTDSKKPLYLKVVSEELRFFPANKLLNEKIEKLPGSTQGVFEEIFERLEEDNGNEIIKDILSLIEYSRFGLLESEILELNQKNGQPLPIKRWLKLFWGIFPYIREIGIEHQGLITFFHSQMKEAVRIKYSVQDKIANTYHKSLADYGWGLFTKFIDSEIPIKKDHLNCFWDLGIYLIKVKSEDHSQKLKKIVDIVFNSDSQRLSFFISIVDNLIYFITNEATTEEQEQFEQLFNEICNVTINENLGIYLLNKGDSLKSYNYSRWVLLFYTKSNYIFTKLSEKVPQNTIWKRNLSVTHARLGDIYTNMGLTEYAIEHYQTDLSITEEKYKIHTNDNTVAKDLVVSLNKLGDLNTRIYNSQKSIDFYQRAYNICRTLHQSTEKYYENAFDLSVCLIKLGDFHFLNSNMIEAIDYFTQALSIRNRLYNSNHQNPEMGRSLSICYGKLAQVKLKLGLDQDAQEYESTAMEIQKNIFEMDIFNEYNAYVLSRNYESLGEIYQHNAEFESSLTYFHSALEIRITQYEEDIENSIKARDLSTVYNSCGDIYLSLGNNEEAYNNYQKALEIRKELYENDKGNADNARNLSLSKDRIGEYFLKTDDFQKALEYFLGSMELREGMYLADQNTEKKRDLSIVYQRLGDTYFEIKEYDTANHYYLKDLKLATEIYDLDPENIEKIRDLASSYLKLGDLYFNQSISNARDQYSKALKFFDPLYDNNKDNKEIASEYSIYLNKLGDCYQKIDEPEKALGFYLKSKEIRKLIFEKSNCSFNSGIELVINYYKISQAYQSQNDFKQKNIFLKAAIQILQNFKSQKKLENHSEYLVWLNSFEKSLNN